jgi:endonuclease/exonuclease/phosphatase (EEP) superfamily protein YafD
LIIETNQQPLESGFASAAEPAEAPRPRRWSRHALAAACWAYLLTLLAGWWFLRAQGDRWWPATLLLVCPRWPWALPAAGLWPAVVMARRPVLALVLSAATAALLGPIMGVRVALPTGAGEPRDLRLLTCNIHRQQVDAERLGAFIREVRPDVVVLQDWSAAGHDVLFTGPGWDVHRDGQLLIASRLPISRVTPVDFAGAGGVPATDRGAAACYDLVAPAGPVRLINVHLTSPHSGLLTFMSDQGQELSDNADLRWRESAAMREVVDGSTVPVLLAGDFNTTDDSPIFRQDWAGFADAFADRGLGIGYTYVNWHTQLRIDHVLFGPRWRATRCWVGPAVGSPHRPLVADLRLAR